MITDAYDNPVDACLNRTSVELKRIHVPFGVEHLYVIIVLL